MTTKERLDPIEEAIKALTTIAVRPPGSVYVDLRERSAAQTIWRICAELGTA